MINTKDFKPHTRNTEVVKATMRLMSVTKEIESLFGTKLMIILLLYRFY